MADTPLDLVLTKRKSDGELFRLPRHLVEVSEGLELAPTQRKADAPKTTTAPTAKTPKES